MERCKQSAEDVSNSPKEYVASLEILDTQNTIHFYAQAW